MSRWAVRLAPLLAGLLVVPLAAAGVLVGATRLVHTQGQQELSLMLANTNSYPVLVQAWVDDGSGNPDGAHAPYVVLPPVFRMEPGAARGIRILHDGSAMQADRETVHWLNVHEIPPSNVVADADTQAARINVALNTQIKVFHRPDALAAGPEDLAAQLTWTLQRSDKVYLVCHNASPFHASFTRLALKGSRLVEAEQQPDMMTAPYSSRAYPLQADPGPQPGLQVQFARVDDTGHAHSFTQPVE